MTRPAVATNGPEAWLNIPPKFSGSIFISPTPVNQARSTKSPTTITDWKDVDFLAPRMLTMPKMIAKAAAIGSGGISGRHSAR